MLSPSVERLLQPSLSAHGAPAQAPYSAQVQLLTAFFGDVPGMLICLGINLKRMRRWRRDALFFVLLAAVTLTLAAWPTLSVGQPLKALLLAWFGGTTAWVRLRAFLGAGAAIWWHRRERRAATMMGVPEPNGLLPGLGMIVVGNVIGVALAAALKGL